MASTGTIAGDSPELLKPFLEHFQAARVAMQEEMGKEPVPEVSCRQIQLTNKWLNSVLQALNEHNDGFSRLALSTLTDDELHRNLELARESSRQLALLLADKSQHFTPTSQSQVMEFGMGSQSQEIRENLLKFSKFLEHFSQAKWLGDLVAPEFVEQKNLAVKLLADLQGETVLTLPDLPECSEPTDCNQCGLVTKKTKGFCDHCAYCQHGWTKNKYPNGCPSGCQSSQHGFQRCQYCCNNSWKPGCFCTHCSLCAHDCYAPCEYGCVEAKTISISAKDGSSVYEGLLDGSSGLDKLEALAKMSEALAKAFRKDLKTRRRAEKEMQKKMTLLKEFAESMNEIPKVLWRFLLIRAGSINGLSELKTWVSQEEADQVHKMLEQFRDDANREIILRQVNLNGAASVISDGSYSWVSEATAQR